LPIIFKPITVELGWQQ